MERIHDVLCNQHGDLLGHKYYRIRLHFLIFIHMVCTLPQACGERTRWQGRARRPRGLELQQKVSLPL